MAKPKTKLAVTCLAVAGIGVMAPYIMLAIKHPVTMWGLLYSVFVAGLVAAGLYLLCREATDG